MNAMDIGHHAKAYAKANLHMLEDACGVVESREQVLQRRINTRHGLMASGALTPHHCSKLAEDNELDAQELSIIQQMNEDHSDETAAALGRWLIGGVVGCAIVLMIAHFVASSGVL